MKIETSFYIFKGIIKLLTIINPPPYYESIECQKRRGGEKMDKKLLKISLVSFGIICFSLLLSYFLNRRVVTQQQAYEEPKTNSLTETSLNLVDGGTIQVLAGHQYNLQCVVPEVSITPPPATPTQTPPEEGPPITDFKVNSDREYKWVYRPQVGDKYYTDSDYVITTLPYTLTKNNNYWMLMTPNKDKSNRLEDLISFNVTNDQTTVYLAYHFKDKDSQAPSWALRYLNLGAGYSYCNPVGDRGRDSVCMESSNPSGPFVVIGAPKWSTTYTLGGNRAERSVNPGENYIVFVVDNSGPKPWPPGDDYIMQ